MSAIASATLLILSLSTVRRTIADTIRYLLNFQWSHVESIFSPHPERVCDDPTKGQLRDRRSYRFALRPIEWFYLLLEIAILLGSQTPKSTTRSVGRPLSAEAWPPKLRFSAPVNQTDLCLVVSVEVIGGAG